MRARPITVAQSAVVRLAQERAPLLFRPCQAIAHDMPVGRRHHRHDRGGSVDVLRRRRVVVENDGSWPSRRRRRGEHEPPVDDVFTEVSDEVDEDRHQHGRERAVGRQEVADLQQTSGLGQQAPERDVHDVCHAEDDDRSREDRQGAHGRADGSLQPSDQRLVVGWPHQRPVPSRAGSSPLPERRDSFTATFCSAKDPLPMKAVHRTRRRAA